MYSNKRIVIGFELSAWELMFTLAPRTWTTYISKSSFCCASHSKNSSLFCPCLCALPVPLHCKLNLHCSEIMYKCIDLRLWMQVHEPWLSGALTTPRSPEPITCSTWRRIGVRRARFALGSSADSGKELSAAPSITSTVVGPSRCVQPCT